MSLKNVVDKKDYDELLAQNEQLKKKYIKLDKRLTSIIKMSDSTFKTFANTNVELEKDQERFKTILRQSDKQSKQLLGDVEKKEELLIKDKLLHISEMISMLAHQWRQPLAIISSSIIGIDMQVSMDKYDLENPNERKNFLDYLAQKHQMILENVNNMSGTIDSFQTFFEPSGKVEFVPASQPIKNALSVIEVSFENKGINIIQDFEYEDEIMLPVSEIMDVILNILNNSEENFIVKKTINSNITISTKKSDDNLVINIGDNGGGIPNDIMEQIFDPYFSTKDERNGTGLGLHICKTIIEEHYKGKITAYNSSDGVVFEIVIPIS